MRKKLLALVSVAGVTLAICLSLGAHASVSDPPATLVPLEAAHLDAALAHLQAIQQKAMTDAQPFAREVERICALAKIEPGDLGKTVFVDPSSGAITRKPQK